MPEIGLYDDRNRFMSPELGRFIQPDPIGFKGDASNLYRYCGNDWANRTDPMGLVGLNGPGGQDPADTGLYSQTFAMEKNGSVLKETRLREAGRGSILGPLSGRIATAQLRSTQSSQQQGGVPAKYETVRNAKGEQVVQDYTPTQKKFPFQLTDSKGHPFQDSNVKNQEKLIYSNASFQNTRTSSEKQLSTKGIMTDVVGPVRRESPEVNGTRVNQFSNEVHWYGQSYPISTQIKHEIVFEHGVPVRISATTIEPGQLGYR